MKLKVSMAIPAVAVFLAILCPGKLAAEGVDPIARAMASVVSVLPLWPEQERRRRAAGKPGEEPEGTAVAVRSGGLLVTALHIVDRAISVSVRLASGHILPAEVVGKDPATDLALLRIAHNLPLATPGPEPKIGTRICAIGNAFGLGMSVTCGVVSATRRAGMGFNPIEDFIQTDAAINPGASGGALVDGQGRLIGVISAIFTKGTDADIGVNFAVSTELMIRVVDDLAAHRRVIRGRPGLRLAKLSRAQQATVVGALIRAVRPGFDAASAGLRAGDIIVRVGDRPVRSPPQTLAAIDLHRIGKAFSIEVLRDGNRKTVRMILRDQSRK